MKKELAKAYEPSIYEDAIYKKWEESGLFNPDICVAQHIAESDAPYFSIVLPPPNVTGTLHMGHAVMLAVQDAMVRYHRMKGERTLWVPGTDHAAIATQAKVEKLIMEKEKKTKYDLGRSEFLKRVEQFAQESHDTIVNQARKMGASLDWSREAYTLDEQRNLAVRTVFKKMYDDGLIYRGYRVINWSVQGQSTISDDEIVHVERPAKLYYFKYSKDFPITIATTRPETKLGDTAVAVNPNDERYKKYIGQEFTVDVGALEPLKVKIIGEDTVDPAFGTGALGVTPAHSAADFEMYQKQKAAGNEIDFIQVIGEDGKMTVSAGKQYAGLSALEARKKFVAFLADNNLLEKEEDIVQNVGTSDRFGDVVEPLPKTQWFIDVNKPVAARGGKTLKELMQEAVQSKQIAIVPDRFEKTYFHWIDNLRDWCISRQIWFGHQIPVWYKNEEIYCGVQAPAGDGWVQDPDTLDTWFSSGLWTFSTLGWPLTTVGFVRHGEAENNVALTVSNDVDKYPLTEKGREQIVNLAEELRGQGYERIIASPILRTKQTAEILSDVLGLPLEFDDRIKEVGFGEYNHHAEIEIEEQRARNGWMVKTPFNMESYASLRERTHSCMADVVARYAGQKILMVSHGDTLAVLKQFGTDAYTNELGVLQKRGTCDMRQFDTSGRQASDLAAFHPTSVMETGYDILFFWVARMILMTTYVLGDVPFKTVYLHGLVRDEQGRKMSKSLGNVINPLDMIAKYGTDATRLSLLLGNTPGNDMKLSEEKIAGFRNFTNKLWNISRFILIQNDEKQSPLTMADYWILGRLSQVNGEVRQLIESYQFSLAGEKLRDFTWNDLADWYLEISKIEGGKSAILKFILDFILKLWHPFMPFVTEAVWQEMYDGKRMLMVEKLKFSEELGELCSKEVKVKKEQTAYRDFEIVRNIITGIRSLRAEYKIEPAKKIGANINVGKNKKLIKENEEIVKSLARLEKLEFVESGAEISLDLVGAVDAEKERPRLEKEIAEIKKYVSGLENKLSNKEFVGNAPKAVVEKEQVKLSEAKVRAEKLEEQLKALD
jgi:valyl-tRNA synthetase